MRLIASGLASTHWASMGVQHNQLTEEVVVDVHTHRSHREGMENGGVCLPLRVGSVPSAALLAHPSNTPTTSTCTSSISTHPLHPQMTLSVMTLTSLQAAIDSLKTTDDESTDAAATLAAFFKPEILNLL